MPGPKPLERKTFKCVACDIEFTVPYININSNKIIKRCKSCDYRFKLSQGLFDFDINYTNKYQDLLSYLKTFNYAPSLPKCAKFLGLSNASLHRVIAKNGTSFHQLLDELKLKPQGRSKFQHEVYLIIKDFYPDLIQEYKMFNSYRADFYVPSKGLIIECDGPHHTDEDFYLNRLLKNKGSKTTKERDSIKTEWCIKNKLNIIRIPYVDPIDLKYIKKFLN